MRILRLLQIAWIILRFRLDRLIPQEMQLPLPIAILRWSLGLLPEPSISPAVSLRLAFEALGPVFIKFGQSLSTRKDMLAADTAEELGRLTDQVPPFDSDVSAAVIALALGEPIADLFASFEPNPLASASVAQVHGATLADGRNVVVKVIRPGIDKRIRKDINLMLLLAGVAEARFADARRLHLTMLVRDYERVIMDELDLRLEAANANRLRENWLNSGKLYVPEVFFELTRTNVMVSERIYGTSIAQIDALREQGVDMQKLGTLGLEIFFTQVFEQNYFHADMHPGNVFVDASNPADPTYIGLDCAIMGSLTEADTDYLAQNLHAFFTRDYAEVARLHLVSGWVPPGTDAGQLEGVIRSVCEPVFQKPISEISFGRVLKDLFDAARQFNVEIQPQLVLLQKTLLNIEGLGRQVYPELDLWETAAPFMRRWIMRRANLTSVLRRLFPAAPDFLVRIAEMPQLAHDALTELKGAGSRHDAQMRQLAQIAQDLQRSQKRTARLAGVAIAAAVAVLLFPAASPAAGSELILGTSVASGLGAYWFFRP